MPTHVKSPCFINVIRGGHGSPISSLILKTRRYFIFSLIHSLIIYCNVFNELLLKRGNGTAEREGGKARISVSDGDFDQNIDFFEFSCCAFSTRT